MEGKKVRGTEQRTLRFVRRGNENRRDRDVREERVKGEKEMTGVRTNKIMREMRG